MVMTIMVIISDNKTLRMLHSFPLTKFRPQNLFKQVRVIPSDLLF